MSTKAGELQAADGGGVTQLTHGGGESPQWSPDMSSIAFNSERAGNEDVYVIGADGKGERRLTDHPANDFAPFWAPDSSRILFWSERHLERGAGEVWAMKPDGSGQTVLTRFNDD